MPTNKNVKDIKTLALAGLSQEKTREILQLPTRVIEAYWVNLKPKPPKIPKPKKVKSLEEKLLKNTAPHVLERKMESFNKNGKKMHKSAYQFTDVWDKFSKNPICYLTGVPIKLEDSGSYHLDHVIPRSKGGSNSLDNMELALRYANFMKNDLSIPELLDYCELVLKHHGYKIEGPGLKLSQLEFGNLF